MVPFTPQQAARKPNWRAIKRNVGITLLGTALLLWAFDNFGWWIPVAAIATIVLLRITLLHKILGSWTPIIAGGVALGWLIHDLDTVIVGLVSGIVLLLAGGWWLFVSRKLDWKIVAVLGVGLLLSLSCGITYALQGGQRAAYLKRLQAVNDKVDSARMLPNSPNILMFNLLNAVGENEDRPCYSFTDTAKAQFAQAVLGKQATANDCAAAITKLSSQVTDKNDYEQGTLPNRSGLVSSDGQRAILDACQFDWSKPFTDPTSDPGPRLGIMHLERQLNQGFLVVQYQPCGNR